MAETSHYETMQDAASTLGRTLSEHLGQELTDTIKAVVADDIDLTLIEEYLASISESQRSIANSLANIVSLMQRR